MSKELEHGRFKLFRPGPRITWVFAEGPWNGEIAQRYVREYKQMVLDTPGPIVRVVDLRYWQFGSPEVVTEMTALYQWMKSQPIARQIDLVQNSLALKMHLQKVEPFSSYPISVCYTPDEALDILLKEGWEVDPEFSIPVASEESASDFPPP